LRPTNQPDKATRRRRGKTDSLDAESAARAVLSGRASGSAKAGDGPVEMLRMFKLAKDSAVKARTQTINQLKAVLVTADPQLRETLSGLSNLLLIRRCTQLDVDTLRCRVGGGGGQQSATSARSTEPLVQFSASGSQWV
jgi:transposase